MKKTYNTPTLVVGGNVVDQTQNGRITGNEVAFPLEKRP